MKTFTLKLMSLLCLFLFSSCESDNFVDNPEFLKADIVKNDIAKMIPFKGDFLSTPNDVEPIDCSNGVAVMKTNAVIGNATHIGLIDRSMSPLIVEDCDFNPSTGVITAELNVTVKNSKGDGIRFLGISNMNVAGPSSGNYIIVEGFGKFEGATGELSTVGYLNAAAGSAEFKVEGIITQPNR